MAVNRERKTIRVKAERLDGWNCGSSDLIEQIQDIVRFYGEGVTFEYATNDHDVDQYLYAFRYREETDAEMSIRISREEAAERWAKDRISREEAAERWAKERDALEFERLKKVFGEG